MATIRSRFLLAHPLPGDEIVISGIAGYFPKSDSMMELQENLFNKVDLVSDITSQLKVPCVNRKRVGKINNPTKFDQAGFRINYTDAHREIPMTRMLLERTYEAIIDAGLNPAELKNSKTGVFVGSSFVQSEEMLLYEKIQANNNGIIGCSEAMLALRISNWLKVTGPAYKMDSACSTSMHVLEQAFKFLREEPSDYAIVASVNMNLLNYTVPFDTMSMLSGDGRCKTFDNSADGFVRSEAVVVCILEKAKSSRRMYAQIVHSKTKSDGFKEEGLMRPSMKEQERLFREFYEECCIPPQSLQVVECHGTGTKVGDFLELGALDAVICSGRTEPLLIGSAKSNMGHCESAAALCSIAKFCIAYNTGYIAPNINFWKCREDIPALTEARMEVITDKLPWNRDIVAINSFGFGGSNAHTLLKNIAKKKVHNGLPQDDLPRLICTSGRTHAAVARILDSLECKTVDVEEVRLWHAIHKHNIEGHGFRGYTLLNSSRQISVSLSKDIRQVCDIRRNIVYFYSGAFLKWSGVDTHLMKIPIFAGVIETCHKILKPKGINLVNIMKSNDPGLSMLDISIAITAMQIALTNVLTAIGIKPDYIKGHGAGKIACAYADSCLTLEQAMLVAYYRAMACKEAKEVERDPDFYLGYDKPKKLCISEIEEVNNGTSMKKKKNYINRLGVEITEITKGSSNIDIIGEKLLNRFKELIPSPKAHSNRLILTSNRSNQSSYVLCSAEYFSKNFMGLMPVTEESHMVLPNSIQIDLTARLQCKSYMQKNQNNRVHFGLLNGSHQNGQKNIFELLGEMFLAGVNPLLANLYPDVPFPVSLGTPMLSHLVEWDHREEWFTDPYINKTKCTSVERTIIISVENEEYLNGHIVNGRILYPGTGYLVLVWETLALMMHKSFQQVSVVFENVCFERSTVLPKTGSLEFIVTIHRITGEFEITENNSTVVRGHVRGQNDFSQEFCGIIEDPLEVTGDAINMHSKDFYKVLRLRGYGHSGDFQRIVRCNTEGTYFEISWIDNWVLFLDSFLQALVFTENISVLKLPTRIEAISIDVSAHYASLRSLVDTKTIKAYVDPYLRLIRTAGIEIRGLHLAPMVKRPIPCTPVLENYVFFPFKENKATKLENAVRANIQLIRENIQAYTLKIVEVIDEEYANNHFEPLMYHILSILQDQSLKNSELTVIINKPIELPFDVKMNNNLSECKNSNLVIAANLCKNFNTLDECERIISDQGFIISREKLDFPKTKYVNNLNLISYTNTGSEYLVLFRKQEKHTETVYLEFKMEREFSWIDKVKEKIDAGDIIVLYSDNQCSGLIGFINCLKKELVGENIRGVLIKDTSAPPFNPVLEFYKQQLDKNLTINVYEDSQWGSYRHLLLTTLDQTVEVENAFLDIETIGNLTSLKWFEGSLNTNKQIEPNLLRVHVYYASLNFRDVMIATGRVAIDDVVSVDRLNSQSSQGFEFVGRTANGDRIMGVTSNAISNIVLAQSKLIMAIPDEWSFEEAATVFTAYCTAYASLIVYGKVRHGESVLIHAGSGSVGQAAINIALSYGCEVFTTVGTDNKRTLIKKLFPQIKESHIGCSRDTSFEEMIRRETNGKGVDVVLNSLAEDLLLASAQCVGFRGRFVEIGKFDIHRNTPIQMNFYQKEISFHGVMLEHMHEDRFADLRQRILGLLANGIVSGTVRPLTYCIFDKDEVTSAYMYMAAAKHIGKVLIKLRHEEKNEIKTDIKPLTMEASIRRYKCSSNGVYILVGGLGGFGLEIASWLTLRGAKHLVLVSRTGITNGFQDWKVRNWKSRGVVVVISTHDVTTEDGCKQMLELANSMGHVEAVFNLALDLKDLSFQQQTRDTFEVVYAPKAAIALHLDKLTRTLCPTLKDFVVFSSYTCGRGTAGQTNYGLANSVMERICEMRKKEGLPALAIQWGIVGNVGYVIDNKIQNENVGVQTIESCIYTFEKFLNQNYAVVSSYIPSKRKIKTDMKTGVDVIAKIMGIANIKTISYQMTLAELGMDSIVALEIKQTLERKSDIFLNAKEIRSLTFARLTELLEDNKVASVVFDSNESNGETPFMLSHFIEEFEDDNKPYILMPPITSENFNGAELCPNSERVIFMVPGLNGCAATFNTLCEQLKFKTCVLRLQLDQLYVNISCMVDRLYEVIKPLLNPKVPFHLLGYSYGAILATELAARLEGEGIKGTVYCIDGSPMWSKGFIHTRSSTETAADFQNRLLRFMINFPALDKLLTSDTESIPVFEDRLDAALKLLPDGVNYPKKYLKQAVMMWHNRIHALDSYEINFQTRLKSPIVLIRTKHTVPWLNDSYGLDKLTDGSVAVYFIKSSHVSIINEKQCATIINKYLIPKNNVIE